MRIEIDQSGKIENTNRKTIVAFSTRNGATSGAIVISARDKQFVQHHFRSIKKPRLFVHITFVTLIYLMVKDIIKDYDQIIIDREYPGYDNFMIQSLRNLLSEKKVKNLSISISQIGRKSLAHDLAWNELQLRVQKVAIRVSKEQVVREIKKSGSV